MKERAEITINGPVMIVKLNGNHQLAVETAQNLFEIIGVEKASARALVSTHGKKSLYQLWHNCYGHTSAACIKTVLGNEAEISNTVTCKACMEGKMIKLPFKGSFTPTTAPLEVVHSDIVGPITPATNTGYRYFLTLVDQHTGFIKITLLKEKSNATTAIVNYKIKYKNQTGNSLKKLITNGGGEFCNNNLASILKKEGIQHNVAPPYTPQHNGIAERANQTVIGMTRCILIQANIAAEWWGEASITAAHTTNTLPSLSKSKTHQGRIYGIGMPVPLHVFLLEPLPNDCTCLAP
jgi:transposase InsO family protein